eukprot:snap_masked-scaffold_97-processed-gene-0.26-mRNA-1 protein AED:1.00 eAED:1.00 QI:0/0/0/0/1/1/3/0/103
MSMSKIWYRFLQEVESQGAENGMFGRNFKPKDPDTITFFRGINKLELIEIRLECLDDTENVRILIYAYMKLKWSDLLDEFTNLETQTINKGQKLRFKMRLQSK